MLNGIAEDVMIQEAPVVLNVAAGVELVNKGVLKVIEDLLEAPLANVPVADAAREQRTHGHVALGGEDQFRRGPAGGFT